MRNGLPVDPTRRDLDFKTRFLRSRCSGDPGRRGGGGGGGGAVCGGQYSIALPNHITSPALARIQFGTGSYNTQLDFNPVDSFVEHKKYTNIPTMSSQTSPFSVPVSFAELDHEPKNTWTDYGPTERRIIKKGWTKDEGRKPFPVDTICDKDVRVLLRDGVELLADVFRPMTSDEKPIPAIMPWSPYGKTGSGAQQLDTFPWRVGVPRAATSGLEKWEAPDPAEWVARGYAVVKIDARGSFRSGGDLHVYGTQ